MKLKPSSIFNFIFFGAIPVVAILVFLEFAITSNILNPNSSDKKNAFARETIVSVPEVVSAKKYLLEQENRAIRPTVMDFADESLYVFENVSAKRFDLKRGQDNILQFTQNKEDRSVLDNQLVFKSVDNVKFAIQKVTTTIDSVITETAVKILDLATNQTLFTIQTPTDPKTSATFTLTNSSKVSKDGRYIALVYDNVDQPQSNKVIKVWDLFEGNTVRDLEIKNYLNLEFNPDNSFLVINYEDQKPISFFSLKDISKDFTRDFGTYIDEYNFTDKPGEIITLAYFDPNVDFQIFEKEVDKPIQVIRYWNYNDTTKVSEVFISRSKILKMFNLPDPNLLLLVHENGILEFMDIQTSTVVKNYDSGVELKNIADNRIQLSSDKTQLIFYDQNGYIQLIQFTTDTKKECSKFSFSTEGFRCLFRIND